MNFQLFESPIGTLRLVSKDDRLVAIEFEGRYSSNAVDEPLETPSKDVVLQETSSQLEQYFAGERQGFDLPLSPQGTDFQNAVWSALQTIPFGESRSYAQIASLLNKPKAVRAVGAANGRNPIPIVIPCHRVIGSDGKLTGFAGGLEIKRQLLELEGVCPPHLPL